MYLFESKDKSLNLIENEYLEKLRFCLKYDMFSDYITGMAGPDVVFLGHNDFNFDICVKSIYYMYEDLKYEKIFNDLNNSIDEITSKYKDFKFLYGLVRFIETHLYYQKQKNTPFNLDVDKILLNIKNNLLNNKTLYDSYGKNNYLEAVRNYVDKKSLRTED